MKDKPINRNGIRLAQAATGMSPADFPLGSMQSRAAARAIVDHSERFKPRISQYDQDALQIVSGERMFFVGVAESISREVRATAIYKRGMELELEPRDYDEPAPFDEAPTDRLAKILQSGLQRSGVDVEFRPKDVKWHKPLVLLLAHQALLAAFKAAWERQLSEIPFPIRVESEDDTFRVYYRQPSGRWEEKIGNHMSDMAKELNEQLREEQANA
jgi:hypothetical protein